MYWDEGQRWVTLRLSTKAIKSLEVRSAIDPQIGSSGAALPFSWSCLLARLRRSRSQLPARLPCSLMASFPPPLLPRFSPFVLLLVPHVAPLRRAQTVGLQEMASRVGLDLASLPFVDFRPQRLEWVAAQKVGRVFWRRVSVRLSALLPGPVESLHVRIAS